MSATTELVPARLTPAACGVVGGGGMGAGIVLALLLAGAEVTLSSGTTRRPRPPASGGIPPAAPAHQPSRAHLSPRART